MASGQSRVVSMQYVNQKRWLLKYEISLFGFGQVIWRPLEVNQVSRSDL